MHPVETFELVLALLAGVIALHWAARRIGLPPATALLVGGGGLAFVPGLPPVALDPEIALVLFLPPLLMDGAYYTAFGRFRRHLPGILSLAVGAVVFTTLAVGVVVHWLVPGLPWAACFALGAIVSPPDAVSARAVLQGVTLPRRLSALLEGESLLNDATGLVLFRFAVVATLSGVFDSGAAVSNFLFLSFGGIVVGLAVSAVWMFVVRRLSDQTLIILANTLICWAAYIAGEMVHVSGVIATVVAGLVLGWYQHIIFPAQVRLRGAAFWQTLVFVLEALVFILIGFSLRGVLDRVGGIEAVSTTMAIPVLGVVLTVVVARFVWIFGSDGLLGVLRAIGFKRARPLGARQATVLGWTGMRGVVTLAVALTLPASMPGRDLMLVIAFAVIFATVVVQGTSLGWLIGRVRPVDQDPPAKMNLAQSEAAIARARTDAVEAHAYAPDGTLIHPQLLEQSRKRLEVIQRYAADTDKFMEGARTHFDVVLIALAAGRAELIRIHRAGLIEDEVLHNLERDLDVEELGIILQRDT
ncbi:Na+/H+ antiporter [Sphingomonas sp. So64.6b]|uniref:Na+/H+ antiporter n=1 Tax=Sphingomonas sp. So64.6b TaxID=2997354 RepID=UPI00160155C6|nr:Na+/H+ antiporter [Sphingomonas sp. So64.6b]QNA84349.1 Na+/H+ antiporter [Sphingomonas sp. So64.6b]